MKKTEFALFLACGVAGVLAANLLLSKFSPPDKSAADAGVPAYLAVLEAKLKNLEEDQAELRQEMAAIGASPRNQENPTPVEDQRLLEESITQLEERLTALQLAVGAGSGENTNEARESASLAESLVLFKDRAQDLTLTPAERVSALEVLRRYSGSIDTEVVGSMLVLLEGQGTSDDLRTSIVRNLNHISDERCREAFVRLVEYDPSERVREEAAECLAQFGGDLELVSFLETVALSEASAAVRSQIASSLAELAAGDSSPGDGEAEEEQ